MPSSTITRKGQVTIPKGVRDALSLEIGDRVGFVVREDEIVLRPRRGSILDLEGSVQPRSATADSAEIRRQVIRKRAVRLVGPRG